MKKSTKPLKPCPFCGGPALLTAEALGRGPRVAVECTHCRTATWYYDEDVAIHTWNKRVGSPAVSPKASMSHELYVENAALIDRLAELCNFVDYDPDLGKTNPYWEPKYEHFVAAIIAAMQPSPIGEATAMPGTNGGFTMAVFKAEDVPLGAKLYTEAPLESEPVAWVDEKADVLKFGGWDAQPFAKSFKPVFYRVTK